MPVRYGYDGLIIYPLLNDIRLVTHNLRMPLPRQTEPKCEHLQLVRLIPDKIVQILWWMEQIANANILWVNSMTLCLVYLSIYVCKITKKSLYGKAIL